jgi:hypothetical protein
MMVEVNIPIHPLSSFVHIIIIHPTSQTTSKFVIKLIHRCIIPKLAKLDTDILFFQSTTLLDCCPTIWRLGQKK